jgi:hypothetical protein
VHWVRSGCFLSCCCSDLRQGACVGPDRTVVARSRVCRGGSRQAAPSKAERCVRDAARPALTPEGDALSPTVSIAAKQSHPTCFRSC